MVGAGWTMATDCDIGSLLLEHHGESRATGKDGCYDVASHISTITRHTTVLPTGYADFRIPYMVLRMQASTSSTAPQPSNILTIVTDLFRLHGGRQYGLKSYLLSKTSYMAPT